MFARPIFAALVLSACAPLSAQTTEASAPAAPYTRVWSEGQQAPVASIEDLAWLAGHWSGEGIGGMPAQESYSPPIGGQIVGHFAQAGVDGVMFYELLTVVQRGDTLVYRLKHFDPDLRGWESQGADQAQEFRLVAREGDHWYFDGLSLHRTADGMIAAVRAGSKGKEYVFHYRRAE